ncbi:hypothetical protein AA14337_1259 [Acetobacter malorum DSM 14337]|uniref:Secreted protein n=1 Tax=Acetobacter malorum DSM 14337 TaxID=1307910 RepID=A0ABQ0PU91_9PROT|nr:hypothetical protein AA14337_1259 [Acetobacter malorum DSM 14337]
MAAHAIRFICLLLSSLCCCLRPDQGCVAAQTVDESLPSVSDQPEQGHAAAQSLRRGREYGGDARLAPAGEGLE